MTITEQHVDRDEVIDLTAALVRIDTRNPPGAERAAADACRQALVPFGATFTEVEPAPGRTSLVAVVGDPGDGRPTLIVNGHLDVVPINADQWTRDPFGAEIDKDEGRMYGRGTADMKGGVAAAICALSALRRAGVDPSCNLVFQFVADEERGGGLGTAVIADKGMIRGDACLVPEPTGMNLCVAERGLMVATITTHGRPAHGSQPQNGLSAIEKAAKVALALHAADMGDRAHALLGTPTCNVGVITGGSGHNTVAESCDVVIDRRLLPGMTRADAEAGVKAKIDAIGDPEIDYDMQVTMFGEASELDRTHPFVDTVSAVVTEATGATPEVIGMSFTTDARFVRNQAGIPAVVCGPGNVEQAHINDEWVALDRLVEATVAYAELYARFRGVTRLVAEADVDERRLQRILAARQDVVQESADVDGSYVAVSGPFEHYLRRVEVDGLHVRQTVEYRMAFPYFRFLFALPMRARMGRLDPPPDGHSAWWLPPDRLDQRAATVLATLALLSVITGYLGSLLTQTITYAADEFDVGKSAQGIALGSVRADVVISLVLVALADRRGRRPLVLFASAVGCGLTAVGALAPTLAALAGSQIFARGCVTAAAVLIAIYAVEEMPAGSRAYAVSLLAMSAALGSGIAVMALPLADLGTRAWRLQFALAVIGLPVLISIARHLPESRRFLQHDPHNPELAAVGHRNGALLQRERHQHRSRLALLAVSALLLALFVAPAAQFQNEFLRTERHYSASLISIFTLVTNTPGGIGIVVGGRLADLRGRRIVAAVGIVLGVGATVVTYLVSGWSMWAWSVIGAITGAAVIPALSVYGPELFPTNLRGQANGWITATGRIGSVIGLVAAGFLSDRLGQIGPALALLAVGPLLLALLILMAYPETAHVELEDLNPEDRATIP